MDGPNKQPAPVIKPSQPNDPAKSRRSVFARLLIQGNSTKKTEAAKAMGAVKSDRKAASSRRNIAKARQRRKEISEAGKRALGILPDK